MNEEIAEKKLTTGRVKPGLRNWKKVPLGQQGYGGSHLFRKNIFRGGVRSPPVPPGLPPATQYPESDPPAQHFPGQSSLSFRHHYHPATSNPFIHPMEFPKRFRHPQSQFHPRSKIRRQNKKLAGFNFLHTRPAASRSDEGQSENADSSSIPPLSKSKNNAFLHTILSCETLTCHRFQQ